jgi:hypothetical protein
MSGYDTLNFGYIPAEDNEVASFLRNTGGLVNIRDSSLPPTPGQILTAIDANNAAWSNLSEVQGWPNVLALNNTSGANDVIIQQELQMPIGAATNTTALLNVTSGAGTPTSVLANGVRPGSLYFDNTANLLWVFDGVVWTNTFAGANTWAQILAAGNTSGANDVVVQQELQMPIGAATNTTALLNVTSGAGTPTSVLADGVRPGSLYFDNTANVLWLFDGAVWTNTYAPTSTWASVLAAGASSGATNPIISTGQILRFQTAGVIDTVSGTDNITVSLGNGKSLLVTKTMGTTQQNGGIGVRTSVLTVTSGPGIPVNIDFEAFEYDYDDSGNTVVVVGGPAIYLRQPNRNYQINLTARLKTNTSIPVTIPHNARISLLFANDGVTPAVLTQGTAWFQPNANPNNTECTINISIVARTTAVTSPPQYIFGYIGRPPVGNYDVFEYRLSAFVIN